MKYALISPAEVAHTGYRVAEVATTTFEVGTPLFWVQCDDTVVADEHYYDNATSTIKPVPAAIVPGPEVQTSCTPLQYINRFTDAEQLSIASLTMTNPQIKLFYDKLLAATAVVFNDPTLLAGMNALVALGVITQTRMDEILPVEVRTTNAVVL